MRAILINPHDQTIVEAQLKHETGSSYEAIKSLLDDNWIDAVMIGTTGDGGRVTMYVDDEGLFKTDQKFFTLWNNGHTGVLYAGKAVITSTDEEGDTVELHADVTVDRVEKLVAFLGDEVNARAAIGVGRVGQPKTVIHTEKSPEGDEIWRW